MVEADFAIDESLVEWTVPYKTWLQINNKDFNGVASAAIIFKESAANGSDPRVLLLQRAAHDSMPGKWEVPGGAVDPEDASILHGCVREVREETGLSVKKIERLITEGDGREKWSVFTNSKGTKVICSFTFVATVEGGGEGVKLDPNEHQDYVWATWEEVSKGEVGSKEIPLTTQLVRNRLAEAFRIKGLE